MNWPSYAVAGVVLCGCAAAGLAQDGAPVPARPLSLDELLKVADPAAEPMTDELDRLLASEQPRELYERAVLLMNDAARRLGTALVRARTSPGEGGRSPEAGQGTQRVQEDVIRTLDVLIAQMERDCPGGGCCPNGSGDSGKPRVGARGRPSDESGAGSCPNGSHSACPGCGRSMASRWGRGSSGNGKGSGSGPSVGAGQLSGSGPMIGDGQPIAGAQPASGPPAQDGAPKNGPGTCPGCGRALNGGQAAGEGRRTSEPPPGRPAEFGAEVDSELVAWGGLPPRVREMVQQGSSDVYASMYQRLTEQYYMRLAKPMRPRSTQEAVVPDGSGDRRP